MAGKIDARLKDLKLTLPSAPAAVANYVPFVRTGNLVFVSGQLPMQDGTLKHVGLVGSAVTPETAYEAAKLCALNLIAQAKAACDGDLDRVKRVVQLSGFVAGGAEFTEQPKVLNGASDVMVEVFGDAGRHSRAAVGVASLPRNASVEVAAVFEIS
jgi:enamine deaminase RidA (YjgF/YER057c/UK114 family)